MEMVRTKLRERYADDGACFAAICPDDSGR